MLIIHNNNAVLFWKKRAALMISLKGLPQDIGRDKTAITALLGVGPKLYDNALCFAWVLFDMFQDRNADKCSNVPIAYYFGPLQYRIIFFLRHVSCEFLGQRFSFLSATRYFHSLLLYYYNATQIKTGYHVSKDKLNMKNT